MRENCQKDIAAIDAGIRELLKREPTRGYVDVWSPEIISGWVQYVRYPELPVTLGIYFDQKPTAQIVADRYRRDLEEANLGSGQHSFEFNPPRELFLRSEVIEVKTPNGSVIGAYRTRPLAAPVEPYGQGEPQSLRTLKKEGATQHELSMIPPTPFTIWPLVRLKLQAPSIADGNRRCSE